MQMGHFLWIHYTYGTLDGIGSIGWMRKRLKLRCDHLTFPFYQPSPSAVWRHGSFPAPPSLSRPVVSNQENAWRTGRRGFKSRYTSHMYVVQDHSLCFQYVNNINEYNTTDVQKYHLFIVPVRHLLSKKNHYFILRRSNLGSIFIWPKV